MKLRSLSLFLAIIMLVTAAPALHAAALQPEKTEVFSILDPNGNVISVEVFGDSHSITVNVYCEGLLCQTSTLDRENASILTKLFDGSNTQTSVAEANGCIITTTHHPTSTRTMKVPPVDNISRALVSEPVDNSGLTPSGYGDGYYYLGFDGGYYYAPTVYGYLYRRCSATYDGPTHYWTWEAGTSISAIMAWLASFAVPQKAVIEALVFTTTLVLSYTQSIKIDTYTYHYLYRVKVYEETRFTAERNITYWKIENEQGHNVNWQQKSFNYGFSMGNEELIKFGIDAYLENP